MKKIKNVLFVSHSAGSAGAEKSLLLLLKNIDRNRFNPIVVFPVKGFLQEEVEKINIKTYIIDYHWWILDKSNVNFKEILWFIYHRIRELPSLFKLYKIAKQEKISLIYTNTIVIFIGAILSLISRIPHIWHIRELVDDYNMYFFVSYRRVFQFILNCSKNLIVISQAVAQQFSDCVGFEKIKVIPNAVDSSEFKKTSSSYDIKGITKDDWVVTVVGSLQKRKEQVDAIKAISLAREKIPNIKLLLVGTDLNNFKEYLEKMAVELNLHDKVVFTGYKSNIPQILSGCKALLVPSSEAFGRVTIEAMAVGVPVIGVNKGATKEIIQDGVTGYIVKYHNSEDMAEKIIQLYNNPGFQMEVEKISRKIVVTKYNLENYVKGVESNILEVINNR